MGQEDGLTVGIEIHPVQQPLLRWPAEGEEQGTGPWSIPWRFAPVFPRDAWLHIAVISICVS